MRNYRLAPTDLANLLFREASVKRRRLLEAFEPKVIPYTYNPFRQTVGDGVNLQFEMLKLDLLPTPWKTLENEVIKACKGNDQLIRVNLPVARATYEHAQELQITATPLDSSPLRLAPGQSYSFWMPILLECAERFFVTYPEPRRQGHLTPLGMQVVFSIQHERFRAIGSDLSEIDLQIWRYANSEDRKIIRYNADGIDLIPYAELAAEVADVYHTLALLAAEREEKLRKTAYGRRGPLL